MKGRWHIDPRAHCRAQAGGISTDAQAFPHFSPDCMLPVVVLGTADSNVMMKGHVLKLGDLGCSCRSKESKNFLWAGNVQFQPPETIMSVSRDFKADVWAAGCVHRVCVYLVGRVEMCPVDVLLMLYHVSPPCSLAGACVQFRDVLAFLLLPSGFCGRLRRRRDRCGKLTTRRDCTSWDHSVPPCHGGATSCVLTSTFPVSEPLPLLRTLSACSCIFSRRWWACHPNRRGARA